MESSENEASQDNESDSSLGDDGIDVTNLTLKNSELHE